MTKFYTSDLHLGHKNCLTFRERFSSIEEMDEIILNNINSRVRKGDELYILGDFTLETRLGKVRAYRERIICPNVHLIKGNHDCFCKKFWSQDLFTTISDYKELYDCGQKLVLCHYPILYWNGQDDAGAIHLYGHMHARKDKQHPHRDAYNVGVDVNDWRPVTLEEILKRNKTMSRYEEHMSSL